MKKLMLAAIAAASFAMSFVIANEPANAQSSNPFNPDFAWCNTPGSIATRNASPPLWGCLTPGTNGQVLRSNGPGANVGWQTISGTGTVTSVGLALPSIFSVTGSPVTTVGTLTGSLATQTANTIFSGPTSGGAVAPTFRAMVADDMPNAGVSSGTIVTGTWPLLGIATGGITANELATNAVTNAKIQNNSVANTKMAQMPSMTIKSNITGASANGADNTIDAVLDADMGSTQGMIAYRGASGWQGLAPSTGGILQSNGAGANPSWVSPSAAIPAAVGIGHRLTLSTGVPVMTGTVSSATTVYSTPYQSDLLLLWDGTNFVPTHCAEFSQALSDTTKSPAAAVADSTYDLFAWNDGGNCRLSRGPVWTNKTTRSAGTAIARTNFGIMTNVVAITNGPGVNAGTYMGTVQTDTGSAVVSFIPSTTSATCAQARMPIWNNYNRRPINLSIATSRAQTAGVNGGYRPSSNDPTCSIMAIAGLAEDAVTAQLQQSISGSTVGVIGGVGIGVNITTASSATAARFQVAASSSVSVTSNLQQYSLLGQTTYFGLEIANSANVLFNNTDNYGLSVATTF